jgi:hypothetical protein
VQGTASALVKCHGSQATSHRTQTTLAPRVAVAAAVVETDPSTRSRAASVARVARHPAEWPGPNRLASVVGFNVGMAVGQAAFLLALLTAVVTLCTHHRVSPRAEWATAATRRDGARLLHATTASVCAAVIGSYWLLQRLSNSPRLLAQRP